MDRVALASVLVVTVGDWWSSLSTAAKGVILSLTLLSAGATGGITVYQQLALPTRVANIEREAVSHRAQYETLRNEVDDNRVLLYRMLCRMDGGSANSCDLRYRPGEAQ